jgi:pimeloyl-ACP methyl ester carboxylesterase
MRSLIPFPIEALAVERQEDFAGRPTLVFLHDSLGCIPLWRDFPAALGRAARCNVLVYDRQGYGASCGFSKASRDNTYLEEEAAILDALLSHYQIADAVLFGHSDGGSIALLTAALYPSRIRAVITEGAHVFVEDVTVKGIKEAISLYETTPLKAKLEPYHGAKTEAMFWAWAGTWTTEAFRTWTIESFLPAIVCPLLVIQGEDDEYGTLEQVNAIVTLTTGEATPYLLPGVKHTPHKEVPDMVLAQVTSFLATLGL